MMDAGEFDHLLRSRIRVENGPKRSCTDGGVPYVFYGITGKRPEGTIRLGGPLYFSAEDAIKALWVHVASDICDWLFGRPPHSPGKLVLRSPLQIENYEGAYFACIRFALTGEQDGKELD